MAAPAMLCQHCQAELAKDADGGLICPECGAAQTAIRNDAAEEEFDEVGGRTAFMTLPTALRTNSTEHTEELWTNLQEVILQMAARAAAILRLRRGAACYAALSAWHAYLELLARSEERVSELTLPMQTEKRRQLPPERGGMLKRESNFNLLRDVPQPSQALLLAVLWSGLARAGAVVVPADVVRWLRERLLGVKPVHLREALRALLRKRTRRKPGEASRRTKRWHLGRPRAVEVGEVEAALRRLRALGLEPGRVDAFQLVPRLLAAAGLRRGRAFWEAAEAASGHLARAMHWQGQPQRLGGPKARLPEMEPPLHHLSTFIGTSFLGYTTESVVLAAVLLALGDLRLVIAAQERGSRVPKKGQSSEDMLEDDSKRWEELTWLQKCRFWAESTAVAKGGGFDDSSDLWLPVRSVEWGMNKAAKRRFSWSWEHLKRKSPKLGHGTSDAKGHGAALPTKRLNEALPPAPPNDTPVKRAKCLVKADFLATHAARELSRPTTKTQPPFQPLRTWRPKLAPAPTTPQLACEPRSGRQPEPAFRPWRARLWRGARLRATRPAPSGIEVSNLPREEQFADTFIRTLRAAGPGPAASGQGASTMVMRMPDAQFAGRAAQMLDGLDLDGWRVSARLVREDKVSFSLAPSGTPSLRDEEGTEDKDAPEPKGEDTRKPRKLTVLSAMITSLKGGMQGNKRKFWRQEAVRCEAGLRAWSRCFDQDGCSAGSSDAEESSESECDSQRSESEGSALPLVSLDGKKWKKAPSSWGGDSSGGSSGEEDAGAPAGELQPRLPLSDSSPWSSPG